MIYPHPRNFDAKQPMIEDMLLIRKFESCVGLSDSFGTLKKLLDDFKFIDIAEADHLIDWEKIDTIDV
jgi:hypothetical protein